MRTLAGKNFFRAAELSSPFRTNCHGADMTPWGVELLPRTFFH